MDNLRGKYPTLIHNIPIYVLAKQGLNHVEYVSSFVYVATHLQLCQLYIRTCSSQCWLVSSGSYLCITYSTAQFKLHMCVGNSHVHIHFQHVVSLNTMDNLTLHTSLACTCMPALHENTLERTLHKHAQHEYTFCNILHITYIKSNSRVYPRTL